MQVLAALAQIYLSSSVKISYFAVAADLGAGVEYAFERIDQF